MDFNIIMLFSVYMVLLIMYFVMRYMAVDNSPLLFGARVNSKMLEGEDNKKFIEGVKKTYFRNLNKLSYGDIATVYYNGRTYNYKLVNTYEIEKTGTAHIKRNGEKNTLTLITCKHNTNKQLVFIFELNEII